MACIHLIARFPGLTEDSIDLFRNQRIVSLGDSTVDHFYRFGIIPVLALFEKSSTHNASAVLRDRTLDGAWEYLEQNKLVFNGTEMDATKEKGYSQAKGLLKSHVVSFHNLNTTVTHFRYFVCKHFDMALIDLITSAKPTLFIFNLGLHLLHMVNTPRTPGPCAQRMFVGYEGWIQHIVHRTTFIPTRIFVTTASVGDTEFHGPWKWTADSLRKDPGVFIDKCCPGNITSKA